MNVLFAFSDTGGGHRSATVAIIAALEKLSDGAVHCEMVDGLRATGFPILHQAPDLYKKLSTRWLPFYNMLYKITNGQKRITALAHLVFWWSQYPVLRAVLTTQPQIVVSPHPLLQHLLCLTRRSYRLSFRIVTVVTDLVSIHSAWTHPEVDLHLLPTDEAYEIIHRRGIPPERMERTGFPVHPKFAHYPHSQTESRRALGVCEACTTILVTSGGVGAGHMNDLVLKLEHTYPEKQILVVTGQNRALYESLTSGPRNERTTVYGFVNNMESLMAASDIVVTKAGPGTLMEALVMRRPVIITEAVGPQEEGNIDFVVNRKLGFFCPTNEQIIQAINALSDERCYTETVARLENAVPSDGGEQIATILLKLLQPFSAPARHTL